MKKLRLAWQFLTRLPMGSVDFTADELAGSLVWFPTVGLGLGLILAGLNRLLNPYLPEIIVDILLVWSLIYLSRGLHLDGFMDVVDGMYAGDSPRKRLEIMHDSHVGAMAVIAVMGLLLLKVFSLNALNNPQKDTALILMPMLGRWGMTYGACMHDYACADGRGRTGRIFMEKNDISQFLWASILPILLSISVLELAGVYLIVLIFFASAAINFYFNHSLSGINGDCLGATEEIIEVIMLIFMLLLVR